MPSTASKRQSPPVPPAGRYTHWLVALIEPQREKRVRDWLWAEAQIPSWLPVETTVRRRGVKRTKTKVETPLLRGYLFVPEMEACLANYYDRERFIRMEGLRGYLRGRDDMPVSIPDAMLGPLREIEASLAATMGQRRFRAGQAVRIAEGAFSGLVARVAALRGGLTVQVDTPLGVVTVDEAAIEPAII